MKHRVLVTGGFGFLGGRISQELAKLPNSEIVLTSRKSRQSPSWLPNCKTIQLDVCDDLSILNEVKGVDTIVHLASLNDQDSKVNLQKTFDVTTLGTMRLVDAAINSGVSKFVYQSSVQILVQEKIADHKHRQLCAALQQRLQVRALHSAAITRW